MSLSGATLSTIQQAGAAVFTADAELKNAVKEYAERVNAAMLTNPYGLGNDALFENWKVVARLSQTMAGIEEELKKVYHVASDLTSDDQPTVREVPVLAAPARSADQGVASQNDMTPTDVIVKTKKKTTKRSTASTRAEKASPVKRAGVSGSRPALGGNAAKLLRHLERVLNANTFTEIHQSAIGHATGIPMGSMTAAVRKLVESGQIIGGPAGRFKLTKF